MDNLEATKLLALIKVAYPNSYKGMDNASLAATVNMWAMSFSDVPYPIMEQAFNTLRMQLKFPPTVAEMAEQVYMIYHEALHLADIQKQIDNRDAAKRYYALADSISRFKDWPKLESTHGMHTLIGGDNYAGTPGNRLDRAHRIPQLDAGNL